MYKDLSEANYFLSFNLEADFLFSSLESCWAADWRLAEGVVVTEIDESLED